jgi:gliding motility-associated-like protein
VQLSVTPDIGHWVASGYVNSSGVLTPSLCVVGNNPVQYVIGTPTCNSQQTKFISVEAFQSAAISGNIGDMCNTGSPVNLVPFTQSSQGVWSGPGISGTSFNPASAGAGNFVLTYNTASQPSGLCPDQSTVSVNVFSLAAPAITPLKHMCNSAQPVQIQVSPVGGLFGGGNNMAVSSKGLFSPASAIIGDNIINYSITSGPCVAYGQTTVVVEKFISADFAKYPKSVYCQTIDEPVNMNSFVQNSGGTWSGPGMTGHMFDPNKANVGNNNVIIYSTHSMPTATLCPDTASVRIRVGDIPVVSAKSNILSGCAPLEVVLNVPDNDHGTARWVFGDGSEPSDDMVASHIYTSPGTYTATLSYTSKWGCPAKPITVNPSFTVNELPSPDFSAPEEVLISDPQVQFTNLTAAINSNRYSWKIEGLYQINNEVNPSVVFPRIGRYNVTLTAQTPAGCTAEITKPVEIRNDFNIFIPSSFTPNDDNLNDVFMPVFSTYGLDAKSFEMEIFDRWGHSLFRTKDINKGWDGTVNGKGERVKEETYVYKIKYKDMDGNLYNKIGHLSLIR